MSRALADILGVNESTFRLGLQQLERAAGLPRHDIRLLTDLQNEVRKKVKLLGLDQFATTGHELYRALEERLKSDEQSVRRALGLEDSATSDEVIAAVQKYFSKNTEMGSVFVMKPTALRAILKKMKPKATMKALGYRSMDSMFKHESTAQLLAATQIVENNEWHRSRLELYGSLLPSDFELRKPSLVLPTQKRWPSLSSKFTFRNKHNMIMLPELGAVVLLPIETTLPGLAIATILLLNQALNDIQSRSALLKLHQVRPDFGNVIQSVVRSEPLTDVDFGGSKLTWKLVHWFYGSQYASYYPQFFDPHLQPEDFRCYDANQIFETLDKNLSFWRGNNFLALLDQHDTVSLNMLDVALGVCNGFEYSRRAVHVMRENLSRELTARYLHHGNLHNMLDESLNKQLAPDFISD